MRYDLDKTPTPLTYKLLAASVVPRPIAWVVSINGAGRVNAAPFSFFNVLGSNPPTVALGIMGDAARGYKDSARNILETGEFVINLVPERLAQAMNITAVDAPEEVNELELAGLTTAPSGHIRPPRIAESPVAMECRTLSTTETGPHQIAVIAQVLAIHIDDAYLLDPERGHIDTPGLDLVGRSFGSTYIRSRDRFDLARPNWAEWQKTRSE